MNIRLAIYQEITAIKRTTKKSDYQLGFLTTLECFITADDFSLNCLIDTSDDMSKKLYHESFNKNCEYPDVMRGASDAHKWLYYNSIERRCTINE